MHKVLVAKVVVGGVEFRHFYYTQSGRPAHENSTSLPDMGLHHGEVSMDCTFRNLNKNCACASRVRELHQPHLFLSNDRTLPHTHAPIAYLLFLWGKISQVYPSQNFLSPISLKVREIIVLVNLF